MDLDPHSSLQGVQGVGVCREMRNTTQAGGHWAERVRVGPARRQARRESKQLFALIDLIPLGFIGFFPI